MILALSSLSNSSAVAGEAGVNFSAYVPSRSSAMSFGPTKAYAEAFGTNAGLKLTVANNASNKARLHFEAFDAHFRTVHDVSLPQPITLYPGERRNFLAVVPIMEDVTKRYRICAVLKAPDAKQQRMCGKYIAKKR